ncbi:MULTISPECIES: BadF/BadG/BcrA/BcrD ATPase family protein [unclassified Lysinibacillus]|uniref:N-acetylglucosamine kinase n=1 Tax=unclassified Lysinibacillus TaxID=2636778 RepID=UPI002552E70B|nr:MULTISPECIES: BadF/BadG/BcrA/BcrD ATPase family protein [unclassified Lysinibacillus]MDM5249445.1 BadF/BadG/BcrA/BcrD ATPase family protein [Lysinibacillus sp. G4S2]
MYVLAIDGGGTKTSAVICDEFGNIYAKVETTRSNPTAMDVQYFKSTIHDILQNLQQQNPRVFAAIDSCFAGMAGVKELQAEEVVEMIVRQYVHKKAHVFVDNDALIALYAGTLGQEGIVQIAGTGAITMGYDCKQHFHRVGGWGYLFDDEGSGYDLGVQVMKAIFKSYDGRADSTALTDVILRYFSVENVPQLIERIYGEVHPRTVIAPVSKYVFDVAEKGDDVAISIIEDACKKYYMAIKACYSCMAWGQGDVPVVLVGGVFHNEAFIIPKLQQLAKADELPMQFMTPVLQPIGGAVIAAFKQVNVQLGSNFVEAFQKNMNR